MLFVLIVSFRILAFIVLLIKATPISAFCCSNKSKIKSTNEKKWIKNITFKDGFLVVEKSILVGIKNEKPERKSTPVFAEHSKL